LGEKTKLSTRLIKSKNLVDVNLDDSDDFWYIIGVLHGDGYITGNKICLETIDFDFAQSFKKCLSNIGIHPRIDKLIRNDNLHTYKKGFIYRTSANSLFFVENYKKIKLKGIKVLPKKYKIAFLRGLFDSDGCLAQRKNYKKNGICKGISAQITSKNHNFLKFIEKIISDIGFESRTYRCDNSKGYCGELSHLWILGTSMDKVNFIRAIEPNIKRKRVVIDSFVCNNWGTWRRENAYPYIPILVSEMGKK